MNTSEAVRGRITLNEKEAKALREHNEDALKDWLDALPDRYQGSPNIEQVMEKRKMEGSAPLKSANYRRLEDRKKHESDILLWRIFERELPVKLHRVYASAASDFLLSPNDCGNHIMLRRLETSDSPVANELGTLCRRVFEFALDELESREHKLFVAPVERPRWSDYQNTETAHEDLRKRYDEHYRSAYKMSGDEKKAHAEAVKKAASDTGYTERNVRRFVG